jgi:glycogen debranching enzyme
VIGPELCRDFGRSSKLEWLETNGTGAFAMGTVAGVNTRRYHGLLVASLRPPVERYVLLSRVEEEASVDGRRYALGVCQYPGLVTPRGFEWLDEFRTEPCATWRYGLDGASFEKQIYLVPGRQAVVIRYRSNRTLTLQVRPFLAYRDYHSLGRGRPDPLGGLPQLDFTHDGRFEPDAHWYYQIEYLVELERGFDFREDLYSPGVITIDLAPGEWKSVCASVGPAAELWPEGPAYRNSAEHFIVHREDGTPTILAGYPWFTDWGRDAMISLPGLLISRGRLDEARGVLQAFLSHLNQGLIPNRFPDAGETPEYNSADATLWMFQAMRAWLEAGGDRTFLRKVFYPAAKAIVEWHRRGTCHGIRVDPGDHLLRAGDPGTQLTWMDARVGGIPVTPRNGKPVEINALWHGALSLTAEWAEELADPDAGELRAEADRVRESFRTRFWNPDRGCLYDVLADDGPVKKLRPNQIFAVSLPHGLLEPAHQRCVVRAVQHELLTPVGLRTLEPRDVDYKPRYEGPPSTRDAAYHQGTVWPWLLGPFIDAYLTAFGKSADHLAYCEGLVQRLEAETAREGCIGSIAEVYDGGEPHDKHRDEHHPDKHRRPAGCPAQAWSVAEIARVKAAYGFSFSKVS